MDCPLPGPDFNRFKKIPMKEVMTNPIKNTNQCSLSNFAGSKVLFYDDTDSWFELNNVKLETSPEN